MLVLVDGPLVVCIWDVRKSVASHLFETRAMCLHYMFGSKQNLVGIVAFNIFESFNTSKYHCVTKRHTCLRN